MKALRAGFLWAIGISLLAGSGARAGNGDVNADGQITRADAVQALKIAGGLVKPTTAQAIAADAVPDNAVTLMDAVRILRIATGTDTAAPANAMPTTLALTVNGANVTSNVGLPGGYSVSGRVTDTAGKVFTGSIGFENTSTKADFGPVDLDASGNYAINLPAGTYQAVVVTSTQTQTQLGENVTVNQAVAAGQTVTVTANRTGLNFTRPNLSATSTVTFNINQPSDGRLFLPLRVTLTDRGTTPSTYGLNSAVREVSATPAPTNVPPGSYWPDLYGSLANGTGPLTDFHLIDLNALTVPGTTARTFTIPATYLLSGTFTGASAAYAQDVTVETASGYSGVWATSHIAAQGGGYEIAVAPGSRAVDVALVNPTYPETVVHWRFPYTMPGKTTLLNISLPALPTFRTVSGLVLAPNGTAVANATVTASPTVWGAPSNGGYFTEAQTTTDANCAYTLSLPDGSYTLDVSP